MIQIRFGTTPQSDNYLIYNMLPFLTTSFARFEISFSVSPTFVLQYVVVCRTSVLIPIQCH